jgi:acyl-CoA reductase-like NAD-dependent aldehyde dehydrogenase
MSALATISCDEVLIARNPATGMELGRVTATPSEHLEALVARARDAQASWSAAGWRTRRAALESWWGVLSRDADSWADLIRSEIGKPRIEAMGGDVVPTLDAIRWTILRGEAALTERSIGPSWQRWLMMAGGRCRWVPFGVVGMLGTWNYPLFLNAPPIAQALAAGNAVVWKASELAPLCGAKLEESLKDAGFPEGLVAVVQGGPEVGRGLVESNLDKGMFTGGVENGRRVLAALGGRGIPAVAELSGFDPAIVLDDAPRESTVRALSWAAFVGCGQTCVGVKRVYIVGDPAPWAESFATAAHALRVGDPASSGVDVGPMISAAARERFHTMVRAAIDAGAAVLAGGEPLAGPGHFYPPTVLLAQTPEPEEALGGAFGPVVVVRGVADPQAAVDAANQSPFALAASIWGRDRRQARRLAGMLHAGMVTINDAVTPTAHASAPFGGSKSSGFGRTKGPIGLREFAQPRVVFERSVGGFRPQLFPYSSSVLLERFFGIYRRLFHPRSGPSRKKRLVSLQSRER